MGQSQATKALHAAAGGGDRAVVAKLLGDGVSVNAADEFGEKALHTAANHGHRAVAERLLGAGATIDAVDEGGYTALHEAARGGHHAVAELLLGAGATVDARTEGGDTALHNAAIRGHHAVAEQLLGAGATVDAPDQGQRTPLMWAAHEGHTEVLDGLLRARANIEARDKDQSTPLMWAADSGHTAVLDGLLRARANVEAQDEDGDTSLHDAASKGHCAVAQLLLDASASVDLRNRAGQTPVDKACNDEMRALLQAAAEAASAAAAAAAAAAPPAAATPAAAPVGAGIRRPSEQQIRQLFSATAGSRFQITRVEPVYNRVIEPMFLGSFWLCDLRRVAGGVFEPAERAVDAVDKQHKVTLIEHLKSSFTTEQWMTQLDGWHRRSNVALVWHGASAEAISSIAETGFASLARFDSPDPGFFGNGRYTTLEAALACEYASSYPYPGKTPNAAGEFVVLLAAAVIGKAYPVTRGAADFPRGAQCVYEGRPLEPGFDTHFIAIEGDLETCCVDPQTAVYHEVLSAQDSQLLPLAKVYFTKP